MAQRVRITIASPALGSGKPSQGGGPLEGGLLLLNGFEALIDDPSISFLVTLDVLALGGRLAASAVTVRRRAEGGPVTGSALRAVTVERYLQQTRDRLAKSSPPLVGKVRESQAGWRRWSPPSKAEWADFADGQRRRRRPEETLPAVAAAYREALASDDWEIRRAPTAEVGRRLNFSRGHAARLVSKSRKAGLLGPASQGRSGEVKQKGSTERRTGVTARRSSK